MIGKDDNLSNNFEHHKDGKLALKRPNKQKQYKFDIQ